MAFLSKAGVERLWLHIISKLGGKVDKVDGKGLSTNDYTTEEKEQLVTLNSLVGDTAVATQISDAISTITPDSIGAVDQDDYYGLNEKEGAVVSAKSLDGAWIKATSYISATQAGEGDASPENIRAISGWDTATLTRTGRNLVSHLDYTATNGNKATIITEDVIDVTTPSTYDYANIPIRLKGGVTYTLYVRCEVYGRAEDATGSTVIRVKFPNSTGVARDKKMYENGVCTVLAVYTPESDIDDKIMLYLNFGSSVPASVRAQVMLLEGEYTEDTIPAFEPCVRQTLTADLPETVYGGNLNWMTGLLTVTHGQVESYVDEALPDGWISSTGALTEGAQVVYPLDVPYTIQLTPQQLEALQGINTVWSDCGNTRALFNYALCESYGSEVSDPVEEREKLLIVVSATEPTSPETGMLWFDIS